MDSAEICVCLMVGFILPGGRGFGVSWAATPWCAHKILRGDYDVFISSNIMTHALRYIVVICKATYMGCFL